MGLDITYVANITPVADGEGIDEDGEVLWNEGYRNLYLNDAFPDHCTEWPDNTVYQDTGECTFRAGSYSGYSMWRDHLAKMNGMTAEAYWEQGYSDELPFCWLINFSDCEGVIGTAKCAILAKEFEANRPKAVDYAASLDAEHNVWFLELYDEWAEAFKTAANGGAVLFH